MADDEKLDYCDDCLRQTSEIEDGLCIYCRASHERARRDYRCFVDPPGVVIDLDTLPDQVATLIACLMRQAGIPRPAEGYSFSKVSCAIDGVVVVCDESDPKLYWLKAERKTP